MFDFGDELVIGGDRIPLLIWIQLLVMLLLLVLLYCFGISASGLVGLSPDADLPSSSTALLRTHDQSSKHPAPPNASAAAAAAASSRRLHSTKVGESHNTKCNVETSTSTSRRRSREDIQVREGCSTSKDVIHASVLEGSYHPCHYFRLAKQAFLKCLGLDPASKDSSNTTHRREQ